jgi:hypothetical protein
MGYRGCTQTLCENGHYAILDHLEYEDVVYNTPLGSLLVSCACGEPEAWHNHVDETNLAGDGFIDMNQFRISGENSNEVYRVPTEEETRLAQTYWDSESDEFRWRHDDSPMQNTRS